MPKLKAKGSTVLKASTGDASSLSDAEKISLPDTWEFYANTVTEDTGDHYHMVLASPMPSMEPGVKLQDVYGYIPHLEVLKGPIQKRSIRLDVPYYPQNDNSHDTGQGPGWRQCNLTSCTMLADYLLDGAVTKRAKAKGYAQPEDYYALLLKGNTIYHDVQSEALKKLGIESYYGVNLTKEDILKSLELGFPVVCGFKYSTSGHICIIVGYEYDTGIYLVHDPYGVRDGATDVYDTKASGAYDRYSESLMNQVFWDGGPDKGQGRIVTAVAGKPTGL